MAADTNYLELLHGFGLADRLQKLQVKVGRQAAGCRVPHQQRGLQPCRAALDCLPPHTVVEHLKLHESVTQPIVELDNAFALRLSDLLRQSLGSVGLKPRHGSLNAAEKLTRPDDPAG